MNHLREAIEHLTRRDFLIPGQWTDKEGENIVNFILYNAESALCFYVGDPEWVSGIKSLVGVTETPSRVCWYECEFKAEDGEHTILGLMTVHHEAKYQHVAIRRKRGQWSIRHTAREVDGGMMEVCPPESAREAEMLACLRNVFVSSMRCTNIHKDENKPDAKLQKSRAAKLKLPLFSYWTLHIRDKSNGHKIGLGDHASPRLHIRRGHIREYKDGMYTWVQECLVGNGELGYVHKDYDIRALRRASNANITAPCAQEVSNEQ
jgi:hypothetical protein